MRLPCKKRLARHAYLVPQRRLPLQRHLPAGRSLHLIDVENLIGGEREYRATLDDALERYRQLAPVNQGDQVVIAASGPLAFRAARAWPAARVVVARGINGADLALLKEVACPASVVGRFDRLMIGSGDGIFAQAVATHRRLGIPVGIVAPIGGLSAELYRVATFVCVMHPELALAEVA